MPDSKNQNPATTTLNTAKGRPAWGRWAKEGKLGGHADAPPAPGTLDLRCETLGRRVGGKALAREVLAADAVHFETSPACDAPAGARAALARLPLAAFPGDASVDRAALAAACRELACCLRAFGLAPFVVRTTVAAGWPDGALGTVRVTVVAIGPAAEAELPVDLRV